jgi:hypothetical protein
MDTFLRCRKTSQVNAVHQIVRTLSMVANLKISESLPMTTQKVKARYLNGVRKESINNCLQNRKADGSRRFDDKHSSRRKQ